MSLERVLPEQLSDYWWWRGGAMLFSITPVVQDEGGRGELSADSPINKLSFGALL